MKAYLIVSHGSHSKKTKEEVQSLMASISQKYSVDMLECAFLEIEQPDILKAIDLCVKRGAKDIVILLNFLNSGRHVDVDIPAIVDQAKQTHPAVSFTLTRPIGQHPWITDLFIDVIEKN